MPKPTTRRNPRPSRTIKRVPSIADPQSISFVADWAEFYVLFYKESLSKATLNRYLEQSVGSDTSFDIDAIWKELERRVVLYGENSPFKILNGYMESDLKWESRPEYMACLLWSLIGNKKETTRTGKLFERLSGEATKTYLQGDLIIYGHPSKQTVEKISHQINEKLGEKPAIRFNDRGVDLIVWKKFEDERCSQIIMLAQCACGRNWRSKIGTMPYNAWGYYFHWACKPLQGFTVPVIIQDQEMWDISTQVGLLFDRVRIYKNTTPRLSDRSLRKDLKNWCVKSIPTFIKS